MDFTTLRLDCKDGVAELVFTNAARGNPIDGRLCAELREAAAVLSSRRDVRVVLMWAEGRWFSCGGDIADFVRDLEALPAMIKLWATDLNSAISQLQRMDAPIVAAVHGNCVGGMAAFVAGADIIIASINARFISAYSAIGYSCDAGASVMLARRMGAARARRYLLLNETVTAEEALQCGLVDEVVEGEALHVRAAELAQTLSQGPTKAFGEMRRLLLTAGERSLEAQLELEAQALSRAAATADAREGLTAFCQKRPARFNGF